LVRYLPTIRSIRCSGVWSSKPDATNGNPLRRARVRHLGRWSEELVLAHEVGSSPPRSRTQWARLGPIEEATAGCQTHRGSLGGRIEVFAPHTPELAMGSDGAGERICNLTDT
jgi:hypothetical protein